MVRVVRKGRNIYNNIVSFLTFPYYHCICKNIKIMRAVRKVYNKIVRNVINKK